MTNLMPYDYNQLFRGRPAWVKPVVIGVVVILVLLVIYFLVKAISKSLGLSSKNEPPIRFDVDDINFNPGDGPVTNFDVEPWVSELHDVLTSTYLLGFGISKRCDTYRRVSALNLNQLRALNFAYEAAHGMTIREAMRKTWDSGCMVFGSVGTDYGDLLETQLERIES